jgi:hypothetical protein
MIWLWYIAMLAYMVAMLTFLFDDFYAGGDKRPMTDYLRVYGIIDVVIFGVLVLLEMGSNAVRAAASSFFILVWAHTAPHILLFLAHLAYMIVACVYIFAEVGVSDVDTGTEIYKWILGLFPPIAIAVGAIISFDVFKSFKGRT